MSLLRIICQWMQEGRVTYNCDREESAKESGGPGEGPGWPESPSEG